MHLFRTSVVVFPLLFLLLVKDSVLCSFVTLEILTKRNELMLGQHLISGEEGRKDGRKVGRKEVLMVLVCLFYFFFFFFLIFLLFY